MKVLVDMNLSPVWVAYLAEHGVDALPRDNTRGSGRI
jgi:predicted nuclease of predicted toxin-antitoxin system